MKAPHQALSNERQRHHGEGRSSPPRDDNAPPRPRRRPLRQVRQGRLARREVGAGQPPALSDWTNSAAADDCCPWAGISCDDAGAAGRVTALTVFGRGISARVPAALANLTALRTLNLPYNRLYGAIPAFLGPPALPDLALLRLDGNRLSGQLPASFRTAAFADLDLSDNQLTGDASLLFGAGKQLTGPRQRRAAGGHGRPGDRRQPDPPAGRGREEVAGLQRQLQPAVRAHTAGPRHPSLRPKPLRRQQVPLRPPAPTVHRLDRYGRPSASHRACMPVISI
ncbi:hypothetical protein BS78_01G317200 [Paspalum vaginatum]|nr:hypothetical protein BS78_01G317200 [Paspalum vaginatum]